MLAPEVASPVGNYLNDIVLDPDSGFAYITDSGEGITGHAGGIIGNLMYHVYFPNYYR